MEFNIDEIINSKGRNNIDKKSSLWTQFIVIDVNFYPFIPMQLTY